MTQEGMKTLGAAGVQAFERRKIDPETAARYGAYTCSSRDGATVPDAGGNIISFPFLEHGVEAACKYRAPGKKFWQREGGRKTFWNADVLDDPALQDGRNALVICEGELDALSFIQAGYPFAVSVPDGAPPVPKGKTPEDLETLDASGESTGKFEFLWNNRDRLKRIKRFIIATDGDGPGRRLAAELVRRLLPSRCNYVTYPPDAVVPDGDGGKRPCKDANDVLMHFGPERVMQLVNGAKPYPVRGIYRLSDYPEAQNLETFATGFDGWNGYLRIFPGEFMVVSGVPSHGKSTWTLNLVANLASIYKWRVAICSPEMATVPMLRDRFRRFWIGHKPVLSEPEKIANADRWINDRFVFIDVDPTGAGDADEPFDLEWVIDRATDAVLRDGIRVLVIDPWNELEHARRRDESQTDYIARAIRELKRFAKLYGVVVIVVAHPTKAINATGALRTVTLYDIEGSAAWFNKADHGIVVERADKKSRQATIYIQKVRFEETGRCASLSMEFNPETGRFVSLQTEWEAA